MPNPSPQLSYLERLLLPRRQRASSAGLIEELWDALRERGPDFEIYHCIEQRGRIALGFLESHWDLVQEFGDRPKEPKPKNDKDNEEYVRILAVPAINVLEYEHTYSLCDDWHSLDEIRARTKKVLYKEAGGGKCSFIGSQHFPFRKPVIIDYQLSWMREGRRRK